MAQVTETDHLYQFDKVYQVIQNSETIFVYASNTFFQFKFAENKRENIDYL